MKDHEPYCSPWFISQRYHSTSKLKELSFLLSSARLPAPKDLLHKRLYSLLHLYIFIVSALEKVTYYFIVLQIAPTFKVKFTLYLYLRFERWNGAENIQMITSPITFHWICGQWISICNFYIFCTVNNSCTLNSYCLLGWKWKLAIPEWEQKNASFFPCLWKYIFSFFFLSRKGTISWTDFWRPSNLNFPTHLLEHRLASAKCWHFNLVLFCRSTLWEMVWQRCLISSIERKSCSTNSRFCTQPRTLRITDTLHPFY